MSAPFVVVFQVPKGFINILKEQNIHLDLFNKIGGYFNKIFPFHVSDYVV